MKLNKISVTYCQTTVNNWCDSLRKIPRDEELCYQSIGLFYRAWTSEGSCVRSLCQNGKIVDGEKVENYYNKEELQHFLDCIKSDVVSHVGMLCSAWLASPVCVKVKRWPRNGRI